MHYTFDWSIPFQEPYLGWLVRGAILTVALAAATTVTSMVVGTAVCLGRLSARAWLRRLCGVYVEVTRNVPGLFWILFFYFVFPEILPHALGDPLGRYIHFAIVASVLALTVDNSPYVAEILYSSVQAVPPGQWEASAATGLSPSQQWWSVIFPQAVRMSAGPLGTRVIHNFKNTSLCMVIATPELTWATQQIQSITFRGLEATTVATVFYVAAGLTLAGLFSALESRLDWSKT